MKALNWFGSVREKLDDPQYAGFFLKFDPANGKGGYHVPQVRARDALQQPDKGWSCLDVDSALYRGASFSPRRQAWYV